MKGDEDLARLEGRLAALSAEQAARSEAMKAAYRERLATPGNLIGAAAVGAMIGLLGGGSSSHKRQPAAPAAPAVTTGGATVLGAIVALAGLAGAALRIVEIGVLLKSDSENRPRY